MNFCLLFKDSKIVHPLAVRLSPESQTFTADGLTSSGFSGIVMAADKIKFLHLLNIYLFLLLFVRNGLVTEVVHLSI